MPHDALFQAVFRSPAAVAAWLQAILPPAVVAAVAWGTLEEASGRFFCGRLRRHEADLLFVAWDRDGVHRHVFVLEHKSRLHRRTALQPLRYGVRALERWSEVEGRAAPLPLVHAVVAYHGRRLAGDVLAQVRSVPAAAAGAVGLHASLRFVVHVDDLSACTEAELLARPLPARARLALLLLQHLPRKDPDAVASALLRWQDVLREAFGGDGGRDVLEVCASYVLQGTPMSDEGFCRLVEQVLQVEQGELMLTGADRLRMEGQTRGALDARRETLLALVQAKFGSLAGVPFDAVEAASVQRLQIWLLRVLSAQRVEDVFAPES